jgi:hypothetical protein
MPEKPKKKQQQQQRRARDTTKYRNKRRMLAIHLLDDPMYENDNMKR